MTKAFKKENTFKHYNVHLLLYSKQFPNNGLHVSIEVNYGNIRRRRSTFCSSRCARLATMHAARNAFIAATSTTLKVDGYATVPKDANSTNVYTLVCTSSTYTSSTYTSST